RRAFRPRGIRCAPSASSWRQPPGTPEVPFHWFRGTRRRIFPHGNFLIAVDEEILHYGTRDAGPLERRAQFGEQFLDALVCFLLIEMKIGGDVGDSSAMPETELQNEPL